MSRRNFWLVLSGLLSWFRLRLCRSPSPQTLGHSHLERLQDNTWSLTNGSFDWTLNGNSCRSAYSDSTALTFDDTANPANTNIVIDAAADGAA